MINKLVSNWKLWLAVVALGGLLVFATALAKKEKVGTIENGWFSDTRFGYAVAISQDWKDGGVKDEPTTERLTLSWRKPRIPLKLKDQPNEALKPYVRVFADSTSMTALEFFDSLLTGSTKDGFRDKILSKSVFFERGLSHPAEPDPVLDAMIGGQKAYRWSIKREYSVQIQKDEITPPQLVRDYRVGYVYIIPRDGCLIFIEMACENQFRDDMAKQFEEVASSITFRGASAAPDSTAADPEKNK